MNSPTQTTDAVRNGRTPSPSPPIIAAQRFEDAELAHITLLIGDMIDRLIAHNDQIPLSSDALTRFHSRSPPGISVYDYLQRIVRYANVERSCLLITLHYIDQICTRLPKFTITSLTVHRFLIAAVTVSSKALCDVFCTNSHYAKVGGIKLAELNMLEREFLAIIDWRLACTRELLQAYYVNLIRTHSTGGFQLLPATPPPIIGEQEIDLAPSPVSHPATTPLGSYPHNDDVGDDEEEEEATATVESSCENSTAADEDDVMCDDSTVSTSDSESEDREMADSEPAGNCIIQPRHPIPKHSPRSPTTPPTSSPLTTPRSAAKRSLSISEAIDRGEDDISNNRPRGRRRLEGS